MRRLLLAVSCCAALVVGLTPGLVMAKHRPNSFCAPVSGDFCQSATKNKKGIRILQFRTFSHRGKVRVCVKAPDDTRSCVKDRFRDRNDDGVFVTKLRWSTNFPNRGAGAYTVEWRQHGGKLGKRLGFHKR